MIEGASRFLPLKGADKPAQGIALGLHRKTGRALKGRDIARATHDGTDVPPRWGLRFIFPQTQGVALGWLVLPR